MDDNSPQKTIDHTGKNLVYFSAITSFLLGVMITVFFVNFKPNAVSNNDENKNSQKSEDNEIPLEVELQALYNFSDIKAQLISLDKEIEKEAENRIESGKQKENLTDQDKEYYEKFTNPSFRYTRLEEVLGIDVSNIETEITIKKDEIKEIIKAIYVFQVRFLGKDQFQKFADGQINQNTKNEIIRRVLIQDPVTSSTKNSQNTTTPPDEIKRNALDAKAIKEKYELAVNQQVMRYAINLQEQRCEENWLMLGSTTQTGYDNDQLNYAKYCILHRDKIPSNKEIPIIKPKKSFVDSQDRQMYKYIENFQRIKTNPPERETLKFCASSFNEWEETKIIKLDMSTKESCRD